MFFPASVLQIVSRRNVVRRRPGRHRRPGPYRQPRLSRSSCYLAHDQKEGPLFGKPINAITAADINHLVKEAARESDVVEFKGALSAKGGHDAWHDGANKIGEPARDKIVSEVIAFANAHGGTLVLGIAETDDKPPRAGKVIPIRECADLAGRLMLMLRDVVEPPFAPFPVVRAVEMSGREGVVVIQVAASRNAPHRHSSNLESYVRRGEHTQRMTMREIQDMTLHVERGLALLERQFAESSERFANTCRPSTGVALRATAVSLTPLSLPVPNDATISPTFRQFQGTRGQQKVQVAVPHAPGSFRPTLRGIMGRDSFDHDEVSLEIRDSGLIEIFFKRGQANPQVLYAAWFVGLACNALAIIDYLRQAAASPGAEYGLELAVYAGGGFMVGAYGGREYGSANWSLGSITFPRYRVGDQLGFSGLVELIDRDFWNAMGTRGVPSLAIEF
jgi:Putative DNA-binding domain